MFPYIVLTIFFIEGLTLKGAGAGLAHMLKPKVSPNKSTSIGTNYDPCVSGAHVKRTQSVAGRGHSSLLLVRFGVRFADRLRFL